MGVRTKALKCAFPLTLPIMAGFSFLGIAYGFYMHSLGFSFVYPIIISLTIFAGSMEFVAANLLLGVFDPIGAFFMTLMVNARHLFYGISMLDKYNGVGKKKYYLMFGLCDESFSINCTANIPQDVDKGWFMFFVTLLNHFYWFAGATLGGLFGTFISFNTKGIDFVMTALFVVIFIERWMEEKTHHSALIGLGVCGACLAIFSSKNFIVPSMIAMIAVLFAFKKPIEKAGETT